MDKRFLAIVAVLVIAFAGVIVFTNINKDKASDNNQSDTSLTQSALHTKGAGTAGVTLLEYGDFQCPACEAYYPVLNEVIAHYGDKLKFAFRNYPLVSMHPNAYSAARAAEAAGLQDKFWEMHDLLYNQSNWTAWTTAQNPQPYFESYAKQLDLNVDQFVSDFKSSKVNDIVRGDKTDGDKLGLTETPTFYLNGKKLSGIGVSADAFYKVIDEEIAKVAKEKPKDQTTTKD